MNALEGGHGTIACASGMAALHLALHAILLDRPKRILCASQLYGATINMLTKVMEPFSTTTTFVDICDLAAIEKALVDEKPSVLLMETVSNPTLRVADLEALGKLCRAHHCVFLVDNTFATPLLVRPLEHGAHVVVHSGTKYLGGHGDVLAGLITYDAEHEPFIPPTVADLRAGDRTVRSVFDDARREDFSVAHGAPMPERGQDRGLAAPASEGGTGALPGRPRSIPTAP